MKKLLNKTISPQKLRTLSLPALGRLCGEIRQFLIQTVSKAGGHLASNLGAVELSVALHRVFDSPRDKFVFDVGHQSYTHKILTGRYEAFHTLRSEGGVGGFPRQAESEHDAFIGGHSGISVSAALGIAESLRLSGCSSKTIAIAGDGSFTDGAIYEGLNNAGKSKANLLVVLNDNGMSISKNTGALAAYLSNMRTSRKYYEAKIATKDFLHTKPLGKTVSSAVSATKQLVKNTVYYKNPQGNIFENLGFKYYGPVDGHNLAELIEVFELTKLIDTPCLVHVKTKKGKGFKPAERNSGEYHGVSARALAPTSPTYSEVFGREITRLAEADENIVLISAAMKYPTGCNYFNDRFPERFYDCGIAEGHAVTFSAGLAANKNIIPVFAVYSTFLQRGFDRLLHDAAIEKQHIVLAIDRAGMVGEDGETHQGLYDTAMLSCIPDVTIFSPANDRELRECLRRALYEIEGIAAVRYPRGVAAVDNGQSTVDSYVLTARGAYAGKLAITYGRLAERIEGDCDLLRLVQIKPLPEESIAAAMGYSDIIFCEEGSERGGIGEAFLLELVRRGWRGSYDVRGVTGFVPSASVEAQLGRIITPL
ncbi:MAG: 1-deoxy-D-xylulose-5-phosphate synthase [Oscillospiraceae bacterium]|nr:1-deoxy-D-xylulose-5-phosphate synthase [Oscillospiraceae bacterium]